MVLIDWNWFFWIDGGALDFATSNFLSANWMRQSNEYWEETGLDEWIQQTGIFVYYFMQTMTK